MALLQRLTQDRELTLHDGTRLLGEERFNATAEAAGGLNETEMEKRGIRKIHPAFRICALAEKPTSKNQWLTAETIPAFIWHQLEPLDKNHEAALLNQVVDLDKETANKMAQLAQEKDLKKIL